MRTILAGVLALCWCGLISAQTGQSNNAKARADRLAAIKAEVARVSAEGRKKIEQIQDASEKRAAEQKLSRMIVSELQPRLAGLALALARENPKDDVGLEALVYAVSKNGGNKAVQDEARRLIIQLHLKNPKIEEALPNVARRDRDYDEALLKSVLAQNPSRSVKGTVSFLLAKSLKAQSESVKIRDADIETKMKQAIAAFEKVAAEYSEVTLKGMGMSGNAAVLANREIDLIKNSAIGKVVQEISGEDLDGVPFKISDYRGKVILLDFWGHW
ncbi:MAG: hypothetical protein JNJ77_09325 [Planctomycetia bacterium]|nr:hypothetical protein [Planctomycetia bacterium]